MKKLLFLLIGTCLTMAVFAGGQQASDQGAISSGGVGLTAPGTFPIVSEKTSLTMFTYAGPNDQLGEDWFSIFYEEKTNVHIEFQVAPAAQYKEKMNLRFASGDYPDTIAAANNGQTRITKDEELRFGVQGIFLPLNNLIDSQSIWYKKALVELPGLRSFNTAGDGNIYAFVQINDCYHCTHMQKLFLNTKWLDNLGLEIPETPEEFYQVLLAFRDQDANGNGDPNDEIPLSTVKARPNVKLDGFLMAAFQHINTSEFAARLYVDSGTVKASFTQPGYKDGLKYLAKLYAEGLIYPESFTQDVATQRNLNMAGEYRVLGAALGAHHGFFATGGSGVWRDYVALKPLRGPAGMNTANDAYKKYRSGGSAITTGCEQPEVAMRVLDWLYSEEGAILAGYGPEGVSWEKAAAGEVGLTGQPAVREHLTVAEDHEWYGKLAWSLRVPSNISRTVRTSWSGPTNWRDEHPGALEKYLYDMTDNNYAPYAAPLDMVLPPMYYEPSIIQDLAMKKTSVDDYVEESVAQFIVGKLDVDEDWDRFLKELESIGLSSYLALIQKTYDEQF